MKIVWIRFSVPVSPGDRVIFKIVCNFCIKVVFSEMGFCNDDYFVISVSLRVSFEITGEVFVVCDEPLDVDEIKITLI